MAKYTIECRCFDPGSNNRGVVDWWYLNTVVDAPSVGDWVELKADGKRYRVVKRKAWHFPGSDLIVVKVTINKET